MDQVFTNLISNSIKYTGQKEKGVIEIGCREDGYEHIYYVKDNGIGFYIKRVDKLYGVFQRLQSADEFEGTGVGLAIVQRIIHQQGGRGGPKIRRMKGLQFFITRIGRQIKW